MTIIDGCEAEELLQTTTTSFKILSNSLFTSHSALRVVDPNNIVKLPTKWKMGLRDVYILGAVKEMRELRIS
jgi:hypothetical protein